ncbi:hypothetical protein, partial [Streptomyces sp. URMC 124]|uniref:hypothetical protein n=1 Tax=Streptomyces sp. URMC 124 TaxID=3423405 RepID=UPI003F1B78ED
GSEGASAGVGAGAVSPGGAAASGAGGPAGRAGIGGVPAPPGAAAGPVSSGRARPHFMQKRASAGNEEPQSGQQGKVMERSGALAGHAEGGGWLDRID